MKREGCLVLTIKISEPRGTVGSVLPLSIAEDLDFLSFLKARLLHCGYNQRFKVYVVVNGDKMHLTNNEDFVWAYFTYFHANNLRLPHIVLNVKFI